MYIVRVLIGVCCAYMSSGLMDFSMVCNNIPLAIITGICSAIGIAASSLFIAFTVGKMLINVAYSRGVIVDSHKRRTKRRK